MNYAWPDWMRKSKGTRALVSGCQLRDIDIRILGLGPPGIQQSTKGAQPAHSKCRLHHLGLKVSHVVIIKGKARLRQRPSTPRSQCTLRRPLERRP